VVFGLLLMTFMLVAPGGLTALQARRS
jgi:hypothetical protein